MSGLHEQSGSLVGPSDKLVLRNVYLWWRRSSKEPSLFTGAAAHTYLGPVLDADELGPMKGSITTEWFDYLYYKEES